MQWMCHIVAFLGDQCLPRATDSGGQASGPCDLPAFARCLCLLGLTCKPCQGPWTTLHLYASHSVMTPCARSCIARNSLAPYRAAVAPGQQAADIHIMQGGSIVGQVQVKMKRRRGELRRCFRDSRCGAPTIPCCSQRPRLCGAFTRCLKTPNLAKVTYPASC